MLGFVLGGLLSKVFDLHMASYFAEIKIFLSHTTKRLLDKGVIGYHFYSDESEVKYKKYNTSHASYNGYFEPQEPLFDAR